MKQITTKNLKRHKKGFNGRSFGAVGTPQINQLRRRVNGGLLNNLYRVCFLIRNINL